MPRHVGLLGGTFDPPHLGHLVVAECARAELGLDEVRFLVAGDPWMKHTTASPGDRVAMVAAALEGAPGLALDDREVHRPGPTYTIDTLEQLVREEPDTDWTFLLGEDAAADLASWHRADELTRLATFVVVNRGSRRVEAVPGGLGHLLIPVIGISSSELRARFAHGAATRYLVPLPVIEYVVRHRLYHT